MYIKKYLLFACAFTSAAFAQDRPWQYTGGAMLTAGGDSLLKGRYTDGTKVDITAGSLVDLRFGINVSLRPTVDIQTTLGIHNDGIFSTDANASFTRFPLEVIGFYQLNNPFRLGAGVRKSLSAKLTTKGVADYIPSAEYNSSIGSVLELQYLLGKNNTESKAKTALNFRFVKENFTEKTYGYKVKGDHIGFGVIFYN
jgi:hypothetical protein